jgi:Gluconate 2-dehydrogenase subunit 3
LIEYPKIATKMDISRRDAIKRAALMLGGTIILPDILKAWDNSPLSEQMRLTLNQEDTLAEICETIIPTTTTPGAKAAGVPRFVQRLISDCSSKEDQKVFREGLDMVEALAQRMGNPSFVKATPEKRIEVLKEVEASGSQFWKITKNAVVTGYFTSEVGQTQNTRSDMSPGRYDGSAPYKKGDKIMTNPGQN